METAESRMGPDRLPKVEGVPGGDLEQALIGEQGHGPPELQ